MHDVFPARTRLRGFGWLVGQTGNSFDLAVGIIPRRRAPQIVLPWRWRPFVARQESSQCQPFLIRSNPTVSNSIRPNPKASVGIGLFPPQLQCKNARFCRLIKPNLGGLNHTDLNSFGVCFGVRSSVVPITGWRAQVTQTLSIARATVSRVCKPQLPWISIALLRTESPHRRRTA